MPHYAVVTQAPHYSRHNGGETAAARQFFARRTQRVMPGPRIAAATAGMAPNEFRTVWADNANGLFIVYRSDVATGSNDILDWTPHAAWHPGTSQIIVGGRRRNYKFIAYSDVTGDWRQLPMGSVIGRSAAGTAHYYGCTVTSPDGRVFVGMGINFPFRFDPATGEFIALPLPTDIAGSNGGSFSWCTSTGRLAAYGGDAQVWRTLQPGVDTTWTTHTTAVGNGQHAIVREHPTHARHLIVGGSGTLRRAVLITHTGAVTVVTDCPGDVHMASGATSWAGAHPAGCWLVRGFNGTQHRVYAAWPNPGLTDVTWQDLGAAPDNALTFPTLVPDYAADMWLIVSTSGISAWRLPELLAPGATIINGNVGEAVASGLQATIGQPTAIAGAVGEASASGLPASIRLSTVIAAGVGAATASGLQASIAQNLVIAGGIGEAQASGLQASINLGSNVTIAAGVGVAQALGLGAQILVSTNIAAGVGTATAAGLPATITVGSGTTIAAGVGVAQASGLAATITLSGPLTISCGVGAADASGLRAIIRTLGALPDYAEQPTTSSSWSYKQTGTLWSLAGREEWGGQTSFDPPVLFLCDYAADNKRAVSAAGEEFTTRLLVYTSLPGIKQGDMLLIGATAEADPYMAGAHEVRAVTTFGDTFRAEGPPDFRIAT